MLIEFSCIYFNVDHFGPEVDVDVNEMRFKTCFYVGEWKVMSTAEVKAIWVTALHGGCNISNVDAGPDISQLLPEFLNDYARWRTSRFFLLDETTDFGSSGAPVVDGAARVVGMLCASEYVSVSWALKSDFIKEALDECVTGDLPPKLLKGLRINLRRSLAADLPDNLAKDQAQNQIPINTTVSRANYISIAAAYFQSQPAIFSAHSDPVAAADSSTEPTYFSTISSANRYSVLYPNSTTLKIALGTACKLPFISTIADIAAKRNTDKKANAATSRTTVVATICSTNQNSIDIAFPTTVQTACGNAIQATTSKTFCSSQLQAHSPDLPTAAYDATFLPTGFEAVKPAKSSTSDEAIQEAINSTNGTDYTTQFTTKSSFLSTFAQTVQTTNIASLTSTFRESIQKSFEATFQPT
eukprot:gene18474-18749_t